MHVVHVEPIVAHEFERHAEVPLYVFAWKNFSSDAAVEDQKHWQLVERKMTVAVQEADVVDVYVHCIESVQYEKT